MKTLHQVKLRHQQDDKESFLICYVPTAPVHRIGDSITLKDSDDPELLWEIIWISDEELLSSDINRGWNNNI